MGVGHFPLHPYRIPMYPVDLKLANQCYLLIHHEGDVKQSYMSIVVDLGGNSSEQTLIGEFIRVAAQQDDGLRPPRIDFQQNLWEFRRETVKIHWIGSLLDSKYRTGDAAVSQYMPGLHVRADNE